MDRTHPSPHWEWHTLTMPSTVSRRPGRPPAANADDTRKRVVRAARQVFTERGYAGATFQEIATRADLTRPAIHHYFPSKRALFRAVVDHTNELVVASGIERALSETSLLGRLSAFVAVAMHAGIENPATAAFLVANVVESRRHPELSTPDNDALEISRCFLHWAVNDAIERGEVTADVDTPALTETLLALFCGVGFYASYVRRPHDEMEAITAMLRQLLAGALWRPKT
jgi:TetR/AcrR family transcriptional regulator, repressor for uid operon